MPKAETPAKTTSARPESSRPSSAKNAPLNIPPVVGSSNDMFGSLDDTQDYLKVLYYGREGSGKSSNALTLAKMGRILLINAEGGAKKTALKRLGIPTENVMVWPRRQGDPITNAGLDELYFQIKTELEADPESWVGVVFDSITDIVTALLGQVVDRRVEKARNRGVSIDDIDEHFTEISDYGTMSKIVSDKIRKFRDLPTHVVYTALERRVVDSDTSQVTYTPAVTPGVAVPLLGYVDFVLACRAEDEQGNFRALTKRGNRYRAKDRFGILPEIMAVPSMERLFAYAEGELTIDSDPLQVTVSQVKSGKSKTKKSDDESNNEFDTAADDAVDNHE